MLFALSPLQQQLEAELKIIQNGDQSQIDLARAKKEYQEATRHLMEAQVAAATSPFHGLNIDAGLALAEKEFKEARRVLDAVKMHYRQHAVENNWDDSSHCSAIKRLPTSPLSEPSTPSATQRSDTAFEGPLGIFFSQYTNFDYNPAKSSTNEFYRLSNSYGLDRDDKEDFNDALTMQFNKNYGTDVNNLSHWQVLCVQLGIDPIPESLSECREVVSDTHVNLVDLVDIYDTGKIIRKFPTVVHLSEYTKRHRKFFPGHNARAGSLLKFLLRKIFDP